MHRMKSRLVVGLLAGLALTASCATTQTAQQRFAVMPPVDDVVSATDWYQPTVTVRGRLDKGQGDSSSAAPVAPDSSTWSAAFDLARRYESLSVVVRQRGRIVAEWHDAAGGPDRRYDSQSMHRALLALLIGAALNDGSIVSLETPLERYLPEWRNDARGRLTIADLLYGRSGFIDPAYEHQVDNAGLQLFIGTDIAAQLLALQPVVGAAPGRGAAAESQLLGLILERATGKSYARYLSSRIWQPVGAGDARVRLDRPGGNTRTLCCLQATARDWSLVGQLVLDQGRAQGRQIIPASWIERLRVPNPLQANTSMFWFLSPTALAPRAFGGAQAPAVSTPFARGDAFYAGGRGGIRVYVIPSLEAVVVRLGKLRYDFDDGRFLNTFIEALEK